MALRNQRVRWINSLTLFLKSRVYQMSGMLKVGCELALVDLTTGFWESPDNTDRQRKRNSLILFQSHNLSIIINGFEEISTVR